MRTLKAPGGLANVRGITDSTQAKFAHAITRCVPICNSLEEFCNVNTESTDQHRDTRTETEAKDGEDASTFYSWLFQHYPFQYKDVLDLLMLPMVLLQIHPPI